MKLIKNCLSATLKCKCWLTTKRTFRLILLLLSPFLLPHTPHCHHSNLSLQILKFSNSSQPIAKCHVATARTQMKFFTIRCLNNWIRKCNWKTKKTQTEIYAGLLTVIRNNIISSEAKKSSTMVT